MNYFKKEGSKMLGSIYLRGIKFEVDNDDPSIIIFAADDRQWQLRASSAEIAQAWRNDMEYYT